MNRRLLQSLAVVAASAIAFGPQLRSPLSGQPPVVAAVHDADRQAIARAAEAFASAFNTGDAKAVAAMWTENGESRDADGTTLVGRAAIAKGYADFFKANPDAKLEVLVRSIRFPAKDMAVEEGLVRHLPEPKGLPYTTSYVAVLAREGGSWRIALSSATAAGHNRLEDLDWLLGEWTGKIKDGTVKLAFARPAQKPLMTASFTRTTPGKEPVVGHIRIAFDPETGQIRSWNFEDDGGHSQSLWAYDGKSWILDSRGVLADGTRTGERIILQRVASDTITWRAVDRIVGDTHLPDTPPMRLSRKMASK